jgi:hypothetical protein
MAVYPRRSGLLGRATVRRDIGPAGLVIAILAVGALLAWSEVTLIDLLRHPLWSLRQMTRGLLEGAGSLMAASLQAAVIVLPLWLLVRAWPRRPGRPVPPGSSV